MWFATNDGLNRYDGYSFTVFEKFLNNRTTSVFEDHLGKLWVTTEAGGLHEIDKITGVAIPHTIRAINATQWNNQLSIYEDEQGFLWISTHGGLAKYDPKFHHFTLYQDQKLNFSVRNVLEDRKKRMWLATQYGLIQFNKKTGYFSPLPFHKTNETEPIFDFLYLDSASDTLWISSVGKGLFLLDLHQSSLVIKPFIAKKGQINSFLFLNALHRDKEGSLWVGTTDGLQKIDISGRKVTTYRPNAHSLNGLSSVYAQAIYHDRFGNLWVGTNNGIDKQITNARSFHTYQVTPTAGQINLFQNKVDNICVDGANQTWFSNRHSLYKVDKEHNRAKVIPYNLLGSSTNSVNYINSLLAETTKGVWIGTDKGLYFYNQYLDQFSFYPSLIQGANLNYSPTNEIWCAGIGGIALFDTHTHHYTYFKQLGNSVTNFVEAMTLSRSGDVWAVVEGLGIIRLKPRTGQLNVYGAWLKQGRLHNDEAQSMYEDALGFIWIGTKQGEYGALTRLDPRNGLMRVFSTQDGLPSNHIFSITGDGDGNLWLGTDKGLCQFNPKTKAVRTYNMNDGFPSNEFLTRAVCRHKNTLLFGTLNGFIQFDPDQIYNDTEYFPVYITKFKVGNETRPFSKQLITLSYNENTVSFEFAALTKRLAEHNLYEYQLVGIDKEWIRSGNRRFANYTNLTPGEYQFRVKAANSDGTWNQQGATLKLIIQPPWWATWWAYLGYVLLGFGIFWQFTQVRIKQVTAQREAQQLRTLDELKTRFFTDMTHELRTPLTLVVAPVERLQTELANTPYSQTLTLIHRNARQLLTRINQLLDLARLDAQFMQVQPGRGDLALFVRQVITPFVEQTTSSGPAIYLRANLTGEYWFDADKLDSILSNLVANALKFTPPQGQVTITLDQQTGGIRLTVADTGIGMAADELPLIFERFYRINPEGSLSTESSAHPSGTGIGLSLVRELVRLQGGQIQVQSQVGQGTTFQVFLPYPPVEAPPDEPLKTLTASNGVEPALANELKAVAAEPEQILVVEDHDELASFIQDCLPAHFQVSRAANGQAGLQLARQLLPDLIISDVMMPLLDGYALVKQLRADERTNHIPVMLLTAKSSFENRLEGLAGGADEYLAKPFHVDELRLRVANLLSRQRRLQERLRAQLLQVQPSATSQRPEAETTNPFLQRMYALLDQRLDDSSLNVEELASQLHLDRSNLHRKLKALTGMAPNELIRAYRLKQAAIRLSQGLSSKETAYQTGFESQAYFTKCFREQYGMTPTAYARLAKS